MPAIGLFGLNMGASAARESVVQLASLAEELGYDSLWMGEHVVAPRPRVAPSPIEPDYPILDPLVTLGFVAAAARRVQLTTGIVILPQRNPVVLAKELATLDRLSGWRPVFGPGARHLGPGRPRAGAARACGGARRVGGP